MIVKFRLFQVRESIFNILTENKRILKCLYFTILLELILVVSDELMGQKNEMSKLNIKYHDFKLNEYKPKTKITNYLSILTRSLQVYLQPCGILPLDPN